MVRFIFFFVFASLFATQIQLEKEVLSVEIAATARSQAMGLMGRQSLPAGTGMLFVYLTPHTLRFWMKNTVIPLSIGFFDEGKTLIQTVEMKPLIGRAQSEKPALYALEVPEGWFAKHKIAPGAKFSFLDQSNPLE